MKLVLDQWSTNDIPRDRSDCTLVSKFCWVGASGSPVSSSRCVMQAVQGRTVASRHVTSRHAALVAVVEQAGTSEYEEGSCVWQNRCILCSCLFSIVCLLRTDIWGEVVVIRGRWCGVYEILLEATSKHVCMSIKATLSGGCLYSLSVCFLLRIKWNHTQAILKIENGIYVFSPSEV